MSLQTEFVSTGAIDPTDLATLFLSRMTGPAVLTGSSLWSAAYDLGSGVEITAVGRLQLLSSNPGGLSFYASVEGLEFHHNGAKIGSASFGSPLLFPVPLPDDLLSGIHTQMQLGSFTYKGSAGVDRFEEFSSSGLFKGMGGDDHYMGGAGGDIARGGQANDTLITGGGDDRLSGGPGNDLLHGGTGLDRIAGGYGADLIVTAAGDGGAVVRDFDNRDHFLFTDFTPADPSLTGLFSASDVSTGATLEDITAAELAAIGLTVQETANGHLKIGDNGDGVLVRNTVLQEVDLDRLHFSTNGTQQAVDDLNAITGVNWVYL